MIRRPVSVGRAVRAAAVPFALAGLVVAADPVLDGDYKLGLTVADTPLGGTGKITAGENGTFTGVFRITEPLVVSFEIEGRVAGDSVFFKGRYTDETQGCKGTLDARGTAATDGGSASGTTTVADGCRGDLPGQWSFAR
jgi:hypothetical protein